MILKQLKLNKMRIVNQLPVYQHPLGFKGKAIIDIDKIKTIMKLKEIPDHTYFSKQGEEELDCATVFRIFQGKLASPHVFTCYRLAHMLGVKIDDIIKISNQ